MLNKNVGSLRIRKGSYEGCPLLTLEGNYDPSSRIFLESKIDQLIHCGSHTVAIDVRNLHHQDINCYSIIAKAHREVLHQGGNLIILKHAEKVSAAMRIRRANNFRVSNF